MRYFPRLGNDELERRLPLCDCTAAALADALCLDDRAAARETLAAACQHDPALALWAGDRSQLAFAALPDWLLEHAVEQLIWYPPESSEDVPDEAALGAAAAYVAERSSPESPDVRQNAGELVERWKAPDARASLLPGILTKLRRWRSMERDFHATLEREKLESLAEFAAGAGHEMNNPLAVISGRAQLLLQSERDPQRRRELAVMHAQALRVHEMIADLMLFARPPRPRLAALELAPFLERLVAELQAKAAAQKTTLRLVPFDRSTAIAADEAQLAVALRALCENSMQSLHRGGAIVVSAGASANHPGMISISVSDDGPGIPPDVRRHLFDPYFSGRSAGRGLGNGLAKCWRIVANHGGSIEVAGCAEHGATLVLHLPPAC